MTTIDELREYCRKKFSRLTPYRLGRAAAEHAKVVLPNPYPIKSRGWAQFNDGVTDFMKQRIAAATLRRKVREELKNALDNGYSLLGQPAEAIADDLMNYSTAFEHESYGNVVAAVRMVLEK